VNTVRACRPVSPGFMVKTAPVKSGLADVWICGCYDRVRARVIDHVKIRDRVSCRNGVSGLLN